MQDQDKLIDLLKVEMQTLILSWWIYYCIVEDVELKKLSI